MRQHLLRSQILRSYSELRCERSNVLSTIENPGRVSIARCYATTASKPASASLGNRHQPALHTLRRQSAAAAAAATTRPAQFLPLCHRRTFLNIPNIFPNPNNNSNKPESIRTLRASRTLPFPPAPLYDIIASVESYSEFLPFLTASTVTARDPSSGYPSQAFLTVGYGPFTETFTSRVTCDKSKWIVEARSGGGVGDDGKPIPGGDEGLFGYLSTKWELVPVASPGQKAGGEQQTEVRLEIRFRFQNPMHTALMTTIEDKIAGLMIEAFERRIKEQMTLNR